MCLWNGILFFYQPALLGARTAALHELCHLDSDSLRKVPLLPLLVCSFNFIFTSERKKKDEKYLLHGNIRVV